MLKNIKKILFLICCMFVWTQVMTVGAEDKDPIPVSERIVHTPIFPESYSPTHRPPKFDNPKGKKMGYEPNTLILKEHVFSYADMRPKRSKDTVDYQELMKVLDENRVVAVGKNNIQTFFGHYYDLSGTGVFNAIVNENLIEIGSIAIVTDKNGYSKGYEFTQIVNVQHAEQDYHYYKDISLPTLAYEGNGDEMIFLQYCRWDISYGLLIGNIGYRVW